MRKLSSLFLAMVLCFSLTACGALNGAGSKPEVESEVESFATSEKDPVVTGDVKQIGENKYGFVNIPADWVTFTDLSGSGAYQYSDRSGSYILTMSNGSELVSSDPEQMAEVIMRSMESNGSEDYEYELVDYLGYDCYQCMGSFPDGTIWIVHIFEVEDGSMRYLSFEGPFDETFLTLYVEIFSSYTTTA